MGALGEYLVSMIDPYKRMQRTKEAKAMAQESLMVIDERIKRAEAEIERIANDPNTDPNIGLQKRQELNKFKEDLFYNEKSPYRRDFITVYGYPPEEAPSTEVALMKGEEPRTRKFPTTPMLPAEEAEKETAMATKMTQRVEQEKAKRQQQIFRGGGPPMSPEERALTLGGTGELRRIMPGPRGGIVGIQPGAPGIEQIAPPPPSEEGVDIRDWLAMEKYQDQLAKNADDAINETLASLIETGVVSPNEVGGEKGGGAGRIIVADLKVMGQARDTFERTKFAKTNKMTINFVYAPSREVGWLAALLGKDPTHFVKIVVVPASEKQEIATAPTEGKKKPSALEEEYGATTGMGRGF